MSHEFVDSRELSFSDCDAYQAQREFEQEQLTKAVEKAFDKFKKCTSSYVDFEKVLYESDAEAFFLEVLKNLSE